MSMTFMSIIEKAKIGVTPSGHPIVTDIGNYLSTQQPMVFTVVSFKDEYHALYGPGKNLLYAGKDNMMGQMLIRGFNPEAGKYGIRVIERWVNEEWFDIVGEFPEYMGEVVFV